LGDPGLVLAPVAIEEVRSFGILGQLVSPPAGKTGMDTVLGGDLSSRFAGLKFGYHWYLEFSFYVIPSLSWHFTQIRHNFAKWSFHWICKKISFTFNLSSLLLFLFNNIID